MSDVTSYRTIKAASESLLKEKSSKFYGYAYPIDDVARVKEMIEGLKASHHSARHWCYAYRIGNDGSEFRANDDGEPSHSAGDPILRHIDGANLTNILIVVVRYFGGIKLGVGGLIQAYGGAAGMAIEAARIVEREVMARIDIQFDYPEMNDVMRLLKKHGAEMAEHEFALRCQVLAEIRSADVGPFLEELESHHLLRIKRKL